MSSRRRKQLLAAGLDLDAQVGTWSSMKKACGLKRSRRPRYPSRQTYCIR